MNLLAVIIVYTGLFLSLIAVISAVRPLGIWPFYTRKRSLVVFAGAWVGILAGLLLPQGEERISAANTLLDEFMPVYHFHEIHETEVRATRDQVYAAIRSVTPSEIALFHTPTSGAIVSESGEPGSSSGYYVCTSCQT
jgi:hypothetical protein